MLKNARLFLSLTLAIFVGVILQSPATGAVLPFAGVPTLVSISPAAGNPGQNVTVVLQGTDFVAGDTSLNPIAGVTVSNVQVVNATSLVATFAITVTASPGARNVNVSTSQGTSGDVTFTVNAVSTPTVTAISVPNGNRGQVVSQTVTGTNFVAGNTVVSIAGIGVSNVNVTSPTSLTATLTIPPGAPIQNTNVLVTTPAGTSPGTIVFGTLNLPTLASLGTNTVFAGSTVNINYNGTNFTFGATSVAVNPPSDITVSVLNATATAARTVTLTVNPSAAVGPRTTTVTTPGGTTAALTLNVVKAVGYTSSTIAGKGSITEGGAATAQSLPAVRDVARDSQGNFYIAMPGAFKVYKVSPGGMISTFAGTGLPGTLGDGGPRLSANFLNIQSVAVDPSDNVYVAHLNEIRKIATDGTITLFAGKGSTAAFGQQIVAGFGGDGSPAAYALFSGPTGISFDAAGNLYVTDRGNNRIRKITPAGIVSTVAGNGTEGFSGDGGPATEAQLALEEETTKVAVDAAGNIYIPDSGNNRIRMVAAATGIITTIAGLSTPGFGGDGGPAIQASLSYPTGVAFDSAGNLFILDENRIRKIGTNGNINTVAGNGGFLFNGDGPVATALQLSFPIGLTVDPSGNLYFGEEISNRIRMLGTDGSLSTLAGNSGVSSGDSGPATQARLYLPQGIAVDAGGGILIADGGNARIRRIAPGTGIISTIAGTGSFIVSGAGGPAVNAGLGIPFDVAVGADGSIYVAASNDDFVATDSRIWKIATNGTITTIAGGATSGYSGDGGLATAAQLRDPEGVAVDSAGNVYIGDSSNHVVRKINVLDGKISTIAGNGTSGFSGDGGPATLAQLGHPTKLALDGSGNLYITDTNTDRIRKVAPPLDGTGTISTFTTITTAQAVTTGGGAVFVATDRSLTRVLDAGGSSVVAGFGPPGISGDGGPARMSSISIKAMAVTASGAIVFVDEGDNVVRQLTPTPNGSAVLSSFFGGIAYRTGNFQSLPISNAVSLDGDGTFTWSATSSVSSPVNGTWLSLSSASGTGSGTMTGTINPAGLAPGYYQGTITISSPEAINGPILVPVTLSVMSSSVIGLNVGSLTYTGTAGGFLTSAPNLTVSNPNSVDIPLQSNPSVITPLGGSWFTTTLSTTLTAGSSLTLNPGVNFTGLAAGTYSGKITLTSAGAVNSPAVIPVTLILTPAASPTLGSVLPINGSQGQTINVTLTGTNFVNGATVAVSGTGVTVGTVIANSATSLTATLNIASNATLGPRNISVTTPNGTSGNQLFTILGVPTLTSLNPASAGPGRTISLTLNGTNFAQNSTVAAISGTGVTLSPLIPNVVNASTTSRTTTLTIDPNATPGARSVTVTTPQGTTAAVNFFVTAPADTLISTYAGQSFVVEGQQAINQSLSLMSDVAMDSSGNFYIAATHANKIFKVNSGGTITTFAGTGTAGSAGDGGLAINAQLFFPRSVLVDSGGNVLIADSSNNRIRRVATDGTITTIVGTGVGGFNGDGGPANLALLNFPIAMALDPAGNLYVYDLNNRRLRKVSTSGIITTIAGSGTQGFLGDGLNGLLAQFSVDAQAVKLAADAAGNVYIPDTSNHRVRKVALDGTVSTVVGTGTAGISGDNGPATSAQINAPRGVALDSSGNLYIADSNNSRIRKVTTGGTITTIVGNSGFGFNGDGANPTARQLANPLGLFVDANGNVFFADQGSNRIRVFSAAGVLTTIAGNGGLFGGDGGPVGASTLYQPSAIAYDPNGNLLIADSRNYRIRKVDGSGNITTIAGTGVNGTSADGTPASAAQIGFINDMIVDATGNIYIATAQRVRKISVVAGVVGNITTVAGNGGFGYNGDGIAATAAQLSNPNGLALDSTGDLYIGDSSANRVRKVNLSSDGKINTIAGIGTFGALGDNGPATAAQLNNPGKLAFDSLGNLYIADSGNQRIRKVATNQTITTFSTAGGAAVTVSGGSVYLASSALITQVLPDGSTITLAGFGSTGFAGDGGPSLMASLSVSGLAVSPSGIVHFADNNNNIIRKLTPVSPGSPVLSISPTGINSRLGNASSAATTVTVSLNGSGTFTWTATPSEASAPSAQWLTVSVPSGTGGGLPIVTVNAAGLTPGYYQGSVTFAAPLSANGNVVLPVTLTVLPSILTSTVNSLTPAGAAGGAPPAGVAFNINQGGSGAPLAFTVAATTLTGGPWLSVTPTSGTTTTTLTPSYNITGLAPGVYTGSVTITSASATNSPLIVPVTLSLSPTAAPTLTSISPATALPGQVVMAIITGTDFAPTGNTVTVSGTAGITVGTVGLLSPTQLGVVLSVGPGAATGARTITVNNGVNINASNGVTFTVSLPGAGRRGQITSQ